MTIHKQQYESDLSLLLIIILKTSKPRLKCLNEITSMHFLSPHVCPQHRLALHNFLVWFKYLSQAICTIKCQQKYQTIMKLKQTFGDGDDLFLSTDWARSLYRSNSSRRWSYCSTQRLCRSRFSSWLSNTSKCIIDTHMPRRHIYQSQTHNMWLKRLQKLLPKINFSLKLPVQENSPVYHLALIQSCF